MKRIFVYTLILSGFWIGSLETSSAQNRPDATVKRKNATPVPLPAGSTPNTINYIRTWEPLMPSSDTSAIISSARTPQEVRETTQYFDGLGRLIQTVNKRNSPSGKDLVAPVVYDELGREQFKYLPYTPKTGNINDGKFKATPFVSQQTFYQDTLLNPAAAGESIYYSQVEFDGSPLNRQVATYAPGNSWAKTGGNHPVKVDELVNTAADSVRVWIQQASGSLPTSPRTYEAGQLYKTVTTSESGQQSIEYKDKDGRVILKKVQSAPAPGTAHVGWFCTYYVYDDWGNLCFVIPPLAVQGCIQNWNLSAVAPELCFQYRYDNRNRMIIKKIPGADSTEMVYDKRDRLVFTRDGNYKAKGNWHVTFYDELNRPVKTALYKSTATRQSLQDQMNAATLATGTTAYTFPGDADLVVGVHSKPLYEATNSVTLINGFEAADEMEARINTALNNGQDVITVSNPLPNLPDNLLVPLTFTFYDKYNFAGAQPSVPGDSAKLNAGNNPYKEAFSISSATNGLVTGAKVRILDTEQWLVTTNYYNDKGRIVQVIQDNAVGGKDITTTQYDFSGKVLSTYLKHNNPRSGTVPQISELTSMSYDASGRLAFIKKKLNDQDSLERVIAVNEYDELGNLKAERLGLRNSIPIERISYEYNLRGWQKSINKKYLNNQADTAHFGQELSYDYGFKDTVFNGNIAGVRWKGWNDPLPRAYGYNYDPVSRLTHAEYSQQNTANSAWTKDKMNFTVDWINYDANGNIRNMTQYGVDGTASPLIDRLNYSYAGYSNKLMSVADTSTVTSPLGDFKNGTNTGDDYAYDANGNLTKDLNKNITSISYNVLNLPSVIQTTKGTIVYQYDANGVKQRKTVTDNTGSSPKVTVTDYIGGMVYKNDSLELVSHEKGRIRTIFQAGKPVGYAYDYFVKDHLGNTRLVLTEQSDFRMYAATMEPAKAATETALFSNIDETRAPVPVGYPQDGSTDENKAVAKLSTGGSGKKIGPSLVLRVMAGDTIQVGGKAFFKSNGPAKKPGNDMAENMLADLSQAFLGSSKQSSDHGAADLAAETPFNANFYNNDLRQLKERENSNQDPLRPQAYLNYILFDDQFKLVEESSGVKQVKNEPDQLQTLSSDQMVVKKSGFLYVYTSNESAQDVFFDNVVVTQATGPVLEETHYYPFGLTMAGISSNALKGTQYSKNRKEFNGIEHTTDLDMNQYDAFYRTLDPQLGRWWQIDPKPDFRNSPYSAMNNNPIRFSDMLGDTIVNNNGANVSFTVNKDRTIAWSENVSADIQKVGNAMAKTAVGLSVLQKMADATYDISISVDNTKVIYTDDKGKEYDQPGAGRKETLGVTKVTAENGKVERADIKLYSKALEAVSTAPEGKIKYITLEEKKVLTSKFGVEANMGATATHEGTHATDKGSMRSLKANNPEALPHANEFKYYEELNKEYIRD
ncbi:RHS repeat-associated core domain-containing protein [Chitinophaga terrae (ex Kim and Jung 2007)]|uniref:RHS repeat-associated core domain-containing protein n=1 Tax=Chitinophaga terrae (ex Kim and Jung 2007) TaxID=408074 RepID=A0A1H4CF08_9BACT|nr:DUF6443 domain-containing protein [Chitinophaga terrae (ex Kim and Jung 2007)]SEA59015.1 RHS repeat-associated core domain-containing protein [Chitinophaga terrae (ex Kim and Jung 2007)]